MTELRTTYRRADGKLFQDTNGQWVSITDDEDDVNSVYNFGLSIDWIREEWKRTNWNWGKYDQ